MAAAHTASANALHIRLLWFSLSFLMQRFASITACAGSVLIIVVALGCTKTPDRVLPPAINPSDAADKAIHEYDKNGDGSISGGELNQSPALKASLKQLDAGGGKITAEKIAARIQKWQDDKVGRMMLEVSVRLDGKPLVGAEVTAEPESFLGPDLTTMTGKTGNGGGVALNSGEGLGAKPGWYRVRISKMEGGKETIPARYNANTELGFELAADNRDHPGGRVKFDLKSR